MRSFFNSKIADRSVSAYLVCVDEKIGTLKEKGEEICDGLIVLCTVH